MAATAMECCRLCKGESESLISVFDDRLNENMKNIVLATTGVEITPTDEITQKVCLTCIQIAVKMYKFQKKCLKNNEDLLAAHALTKKAAGAAEAAKVIAAAPSALKISPVLPKKPPTAIRSGNNHDRLTAKYKHAHPSIKAILKTYPSIKLPPMALTSHVEPYITLLTDEVTDWFEGKSEAIDYQKKLAERAALAFEADEQKEKELLSSQKKRKQIDDGIGGETSEVLTKIDAMCNEDKDGGAKRRKIETTKSSETQPTTIRLNGVKITPPIPFDGSHLCRLLSQQDTHVKKIVINPANVMKQSPTDLMAATKEDSAVKPVRRKPGPKSRTMKSPFPPSLDNMVENENDKKPLVIKFNKVRATRAQTNEGMPKLENMVDDSEYNKQYVNMEHAYANTSHINGSTAYGLRLHRNRVYSEDNDDDFNRAEGGGDAYENNDPDYELNSASESEASDITAGSLSVDSVSNTKRTVSVFTCSVCNSVHYTQKDLKIHEKKTHTKCQFCNAKFRTRLVRDEHVKNDCVAAMNSAPVEMKDAKLELVRVDEDEEIRKKYKSAFISEEEEIVTKETEPIAPPPPPPPTIAEDQKKKLPESKKPPQPKQLSTPKKSSQKASIADVICISDEEAEKNNQQKKKAVAKKAVPTDNVIVLNSQPKINILNNNILEKINLRDSDTNILRLILKDVSRNSDKPYKNTKPDVLPNNSSIIEGESIGAERVQILKNLKNHLNLYRIPVDIQYGENLKLEYNYTKPMLPKRKRDFWYNLPAMDLQRVEPAIIQLQYSRREEDATNKTYAQPYVNQSPKTYSRNAPTLQCTSVIKPIKMPTTTATPQRPVVLNNKILNSPQNVVVATSVNQSTNVQSTSSLVNFNTFQQPSIMSHFQPVNNFVITSVQGGVGVVNLEPVTTSPMKPPQNMYLMSAPLANGTHVTQAAQPMNVANPSKYMVLSAKAVNKPANQKQVFNPMALATLTALPQQANESQAAAPAQQANPALMQYTPTLATIQTSSARIQQAPTSILKTSAPIQQASTSVMKTTAPIQRAPRPIQKSPVPIQPAPMPIQKAPVPIQPAPMPIEKAPIPIQPTPVPIQPAPVPIQKPPAPIRVKNLSELS